MRLRVTLSFWCNTRKSPSRALSEQGPLCALEVRRMIMGAAARQSWWGSSTQWGDPVQPSSLQSPSPRRDGQGRTGAPQRPRKLRCRSPHPTPPPLCSFPVPGLSCCPASESAKLEPAQRIWNHLTPWPTSLHPHTALGMLFVVVAAIMGFSGLPLWNPQGGN